MTTTESQFVRGEGMSRLEEGPETPAHVFAIRAFKTALFGTPHPSQEPGNEKPKSMTHSETSLADGRALSEIKGDIPTAVMSEAAVESLQAVLDPLLSPAKGILLTPGVGASRRKNVSFMHAKTNGHNDQTVKSVLKSSSQDNSPSRGSRTRASQRAPSSFTKHLMELSRQHVQEQTNTPQNSLDASQAVSKIGKIRDHTLNSTIPSDHTVDLSQPRSRSGQHWKTEYERYYSKSDKEMRHVLKYGQNVKSYAVKKDSEASRLAEKLQKEKAKVKMLEGRLSRLSDRLNMAQMQDDKSDGAQARLVGELAQQTALAKQYKHMLDGCRKNGQEKPGAVEKNEGIDCSLILPNLHDVVTKTTSSANLEIEISQLRRANDATKLRKDALESENMSLRREIICLKRALATKEIQHPSSDTPRGIAFADHEASKAIPRALPSDTSESQSSREIPRGSLGTRTPDQARDRPTYVIQDNLDDSLSYTPKSTVRSKSYISPRKRRQQQRGHIDIWTSISPEQQTSIPAASAADQASLPRLPDQDDIGKVLQAIDQNLAAEEQNLHEIRQSARSNKFIKSLHFDNNNDCKDKDPSILYQTMSSPAKLTRPARRSRDNQEDLSSAFPSSFLAHSTTRSRRAALSPGRAAAAKARLAARRSALRT